MKMPTCWESQENGNVSIKAGKSLVSVATLASLVTDFLIKVILLVLTTGFLHCVGKIMYMVAYCPKPNLRSVLARERSIW